jgi:hypothetical protein
VQQIQRGNTIDIGEAAIRIRAQIETRQQLEQSPMGAVGEFHGHRLFVERLDVARDDTAQHLAQAALVGLVVAQALEFLLEGFEGVQSVVLICNPRIKIIHVSFSEIRKKLQLSTPALSRGQMTVLQTDGATPGVVKRGDTAYM